MGTPRSRGCRSTWLWSALGLGLLVLLVRPAGGEPAPGAAAATEEGFDLGKSSLYVARTLWNGSTKQPLPDGNHVALWLGIYKGATYQVEVVAYSLQERPVRCPEDAVAAAEKYEQEHGTPAFAYGTKEAVGGPFGAGGYGVLCKGSKRLPDGQAVDLLVMVGLLDQHAYMVNVQLWPPLGGEECRQILDQLREGVRVRMPDSDPRWTKEEAEKRWSLAVTDPKVRRQLKITRSKHYIVLANTAGGKRFAEMMERVYAKCEQVLPQPPGEDSRLLPLLLFADRGDFDDWSEHATGRRPAPTEAVIGRQDLNAFVTYAGSVAEVEQGRGAVVQYLRNRLHLRAGGWFDLGLAYYLCGKVEEIQAYARNAVRQGKSLPLRDLVLEGTGFRLLEPALQLASLMAFLREGNLRPEKFPDFVRQVGRCDPQDVDQVEAELKALYDLGIEGLQAAWAEYWKPK